jgi:dephospho-CoA kinase
MKVIGVVGLNGSGKDEVLNYLHQKYAIPFLSVGDIVREIASAEGLELNRENLDKVTERYFQEFGKGYFLKLIIKKIVQNRWSTCGISGVRSPQDVAIFREAFKDDFILVKVFISDPRVRFERMRSRGSQRDDLTYPQFLEQDQASQAIFHIHETLNLADMAISNDGTLEALHNQIEHLVKASGIS